ncbi:MAG TPA: hydrolase TatD [Erysipelotrichaceae bacterium]|nr:hydrolase TatD [Erysipelotrichaceae bacterium]
MGNIGWIDTHTHLLDEALVSELDELISKAQEQGVSRFLVVAIDLKQAEEGIKLCEKYPQVDLAVGFHPSDIETIQDNDFEKLEEYLIHPRVVAVGEIGLDFYWHQHNKEEQKEIFIKQIELANKYQLPIIVHMREATEQTFEVLKTHVPAYSGMMHCYSGSAEMAAEFVKIGMHISLGGPVTFKNARVPKEVAKVVPLDKLHIETDSPYLTPHPFRGKRNDSSYLPLVGKEIAFLREMEENALKRALSDNYTRLFKHKC